MKRIEIASSKSTPQLSEAEQQVVNNINPRQQQQQLFFKLVPLPTCRAVKNEVMNIHQELHKSDRARTLELEKQPRQSVLPSTAQTIGFTQTRTTTTTAATIAMLPQTSQLEQQPVPETCTGIQTPIRPQATFSHFQSHSSPIQTSTHPITKKTNMPICVDYRRLNKLQPEIKK